MVITDIGKKRVSYLISTCLREDIAGEVMSFFKKVNDNEDRSVSESSKSNTTSFSDVNTEISDLDSLLDKVLAEKKADSRRLSSGDEIKSVKASDLLKGHSSSEPEEEERQIILNQDDDYPDQETWNTDDKTSSDPAADYETSTEPDTDYETSSEAALDYEPSTETGTDYNYEPNADNSFDDSDLMGTDDSDHNETESILEQDSGYKDNSAADLLGEKKADRGHAASILSSETPYEDSVEDSVNEAFDGEEEEAEDQENFTAPFSSYKEPDQDTEEKFDYQGSSSDKTEDALLQQIDAFRDKAVRLSGLIDANQKKVVSLETEVRKKENQISDKEKRIAALQDELVKKQQEADSLVTTVESQVDRMLSSVKKEVAGLGGGLSSQISRENKEESAKIAGVMDKVNSSVTEIKDYLAKASEDKSLQEMKEELSEKIHSENVKVYRNISDTMKEMDHSEQLDISIDEKYHSLKGRFGVLLIVAILNLGISAVLILMKIGILPENILNIFGI